MGNFAVPEVVRLNLKIEGEWIEIKKVLNAGEERKQAFLAKTHVVVDGKLYDTVDWSEYEFLRDDLWITAWHIHDAQGNVPPKSVAALKALTVEKFNEIDNAVLAYIINQATEKKKERMTPPSLNEIASNDVLTSTS